MGEFLLDSDVLIDLLKGHAPTIQALRHFPIRTRMYYSAISEAELWAGVPTDEGEEAQALSRLLSSMEPVAIDGSVARAAGRYRHDYQASHGTSLADALVAASAKIHSLSLITRNTRHFPMKDIQVLQPEDVVG